MVVFKCKMCGGTIEFEQGATVGVCDSCGTKQTLPRLDDDRRANLYDRANHFRRNNEFDKAVGIYEQILTEDTSDAEAYWSLVLCRYGIEYVEDPATRKRVPTVNRAQYTSVFDDDNYKQALQYADSYQRSLYEEEANAINEIQKGILAISQKEEPFDVFICYKETDNNGRRTPDSVLANDLYHQLTQEGFKVFFARITLEDKLGTAYEPYIFAALNSAKVMVVLGTKPENFNAAWVKNEWSRYLSLVRQSGGKKVLIPAYKDMDPYDLPEEFSHLQAQDMSKLGFMQDLIRGIKKIVQTDEPKTVAKEAAVVGAVNTNITPFLERAFLFLEDGKWQDANIYCEKVLDIDPKNAEAYLGKLMADLQIRSRKQLADCPEPFDNNENFGKVLRFGDEKIETEMRGYITHINERNENARLTSIYNRAVSTMHNANNEEAFKAAANTFKTIRGFKDADSLVEQCLEKSEVCRKNETYASARSQMTRNTVSGYETAINIFRMIPGWKDADEQIHACQRKIEEIKVKEEEDRLEAERKAEERRLEAERKAEERRIAAQKTAKKIKKIAIIVTPIIIICTAFAILLPTVIIPNVKYNAAVDLYNEGKFDEALTAFKELKGYKDSSEQITKCRTAIKDGEYNAAVDLYNEGKYDEAADAFRGIYEYKDSSEMLRKCETAIKDVEYNAAVDLYNEGKYNEAAVAFEALSGFKDSSDLLTKCETAIKDSKYNAAMELYNAGKYQAAYTAFNELSYKDSKDKALECRFLMEKANLSRIEVGDTITLGDYDQDGNANNGKEAIPWIVLKVEGNKALVISKYVLDCQKYNDSSGDVTWEQCYLRKWLNDTFLTSAFGSRYQDLIASVPVSADKNPNSNANPGNGTTDKVFLLSVTEVKEYHERSPYLALTGIPTTTCDNKIKRESETGDTWWWLRSPGEDSHHAAVVNHLGSVINDGLQVTRKGIAIRPAMWINLD